MADDMERLIGMAMPSDMRALSGVEESVWARIAERREQARMGKLRVAVVAFALMIGFVNGGLMLTAPRVEPSELNVFSVSAGASPIAGLEARG